MFYRAATSGRKTRNLLTPAGLAFYIALVGLFIALSIWLDKLLEFPRIINPSLNVAVSLPIMTIGLFLIAWSILHFIKVKGTPVPFNPPPKLVTTGPYSYSRNPMTTGLFIFLAGLGFLLSSISLVLIFTPLFILLNALELKTVEEPELERRLGEEYVEYKKRVPMFIPRFNRRI